MNKDDAYTQEDHEFRVLDPYARAKYLITLDWLPRNFTNVRTLVHVGCGSGVFNEMAVERGFRVQAYEPDPVAAAIAVRRAPANCSVAVVALEEIPMSADADVVVMHDVLEHIADDGVAVRHLKGLVRPDGVLIVSVPAMPSLFGYHDEQLGHYRRYTKAALRQVLESEFDVVRLRYFGMTFIPLTWFVSKVLRRPYPTAQATEQRSVIGKAFSVLCSIERRIPTPIGTSVIALCRPRRDGRA